MGCTEQGRVAARGKLSGQPHVSYRASLARQRWLASWQARLSSASDQARHLGQARAAYARTLNTCPQPYQCLTCSAACCSPATRQRSGWAGATQEFARAAAWSRRHGRRQPGPLGRSCTSPARPQGGMGAERRGCTCGVGASAGCSGAQHAGACPRGPADLPTLSWSRASCSASH